MNKSEWCVYQNADELIILCPVCGTTHVVLNDTFPVLCCDLRAPHSGCNEPIPNGVRVEYLKILNK